MLGQVCCGLWWIRADVSGLRGCIASSRQATRAGRESTPHQPAHARCTRPTHNAHQSQAKPAHARCTEPTGGAQQSQAKPAHARCTEPTCGARQTQVNSASTRTCALHRADTRRAANASQLRINPYMRVAPSRQAAHTKRKSTPSQPAHARCTEPTGGAPNVSRLRLNLHMCIAPSRHATHTKRKSTPRQPAHARCIEPTRGAHQTQVNSASSRTCALH